MSIGDRHRDRIRIDENRARRDETRATDDAEATRARVLELEAVLAAERAALVAERQRAADIEAKHDRLHEAFRQLQFELELLKRRLFHAKAERIDTGQLELEFAAKLAALDTLAGQLQSNEAPAGPAAGASEDDASEGGPRGSKRKPQQRRGEDVAISMSSIFPRSASRFRISSSTARSNGSARRRARR